MEIFDLSWAVDPRSTSSVSGVKSMGAAMQLHPLTVGTIALPEQPSNVRFGGKDRKALYVTART
jgi:sugar lactone lactonase YvrE